MVAVRDVAQDKVIIGSYSPENRTNFDTVWFEEFNLGGVVHDARRSHPLRELWLPDQNDLTKWYPGMRSNGMQGIVFHAFYQVREADWMWGLGATGMFNSMKFRAEKLGEHFAANDHLKSIIAANEAVANDSDQPRNTKYTEKRGPGVVNEQIKLVGDQMPDGVRTFYCDFNFLREDIPGHTAKWNGIKAVLQKALDDGVTNLGLAVQAHIHGQYKGTNVTKLRIVEVVQWCAERGIHVTLQEVDVWEHTYEQSYVTLMAFLKIYLEAVRDFGIDTPQIHLWRLYGSWAESQDPNAKAKYLNADATKTLCFKAVYDVISEFVGTAPPPPDPDGSLSEKFDQFVQETRAEIANLRSDVTELQEAGGGTADPRVDAILAQLDRVGAAWGASEAGLLTPDVPAGALASLPAEAMASYMAAVTETDAQLYKRIKAYREQ